MADPFVEAPAADANLLAQHSTTVKLTNEEELSKCTREPCAICLNDFALNDLIRVLPCAHHYHLACVDPWLLEKRESVPSACGR